MSTFHIIEDVQQQTNSSSILNNSAVVQHQIEKKRIRTVGNFQSNGTPLTTTATASSAKFSVTSTAEGKSVVSSLSMSLERKDSIQYLPRKIAPCIIPAGQSTVIHLDNYTHFMAQRVTTTKTAIKRTELIGEVQNESKVPSTTTVASCSSSSSSSGGIVDIDLKVILGGVTSSYRRNNNKTLNMNKQKVLDTKATSSLKMRGRKNSIALECKQQREVKKLIDIKTAKSDTSAVIKPVLKKPKTNRRRRVLKPRQPRKPKANPKNLNVQINVNEETNMEKLEKPQISHITQPDNNTKVLQPCVYTLQNTKCRSEMTCQFLHSDFPCKYYYLNLVCPLGFKCQFMHNGPLEPKLMKALRSHILDLLSTHPSAVETHFIQQLHNIEDLSQRLQSFQRNQDQQTYEVIEVMDDGDEDQVLTIDESSGEVNISNFTEPSTNSVAITSNNSTALEPVPDKYDVVYQNFKETNNIIDDIDQKLQNLKTTSNMTASEKIHELQTIYELLKEQEKRLPMYENLNAAATSAQISTIYNNITNNSLEFGSQTHLSNDDQSHIVLVNPEIVNEIQTSDSQDNPEYGINEIKVSESQENREAEENIITITDDNECLPTNDLNVPPDSGMEEIFTEKLPQQNGMESSGNDEMTCLRKEIEQIVFNMPSNMASKEEQPTNNNEKVLNDKENFGKPEEEENNETNDINNFEQLPFANEKQEEFAKQFHTPDILDKNKSYDLSEHEKRQENIELNNTLKANNKTPDLALALDGKEAIEKPVAGQQAASEEGEDESPPYEQITAKSAKRNRIRLRSHTQQDNEDNTSNNNSENIGITSSHQLELTIPIKTRRLRLPKPITKSSEKSSNNEECQINADIINKLINASANQTSPKNPDKALNVLQDVEVPLTQNVIITKRFMKKAKAKLEQQSLINETLATTAGNNHNIDAYVKQSMFALASGANDENLNRIENIDVTLLTQTSDDSSTLNPSQDPLTVETDSDSVNVSKSNNEIAIANDYQDHIKTPLTNKKKNDSNNFITPTSRDDFESVNKLHTKRRISFENAITSSPCSAYKEQFNLGNPHVVLTKLKSPYLLQNSQKVIQADSTTTNNVNPIVTSSSIAALADDKSSQKRHSFTSEYDLDSSLKETKCLKIDNVKSVRKVNFDNRKRTYSGQSNASKEGDFDTDSSDEKLTIVDALQTSTTSASNERKQAFEPSTTHVATHHSHQQHIHKEQQENESDLRQQIENVSNKSDLQLQIQQQQQQQQQQKGVDERTTAGNSCIAKNSNNLPHKQYEMNENILVRVEEQSKELLQQKQYESNFKEEDQCNAMARSPYGNIADNGQTQYSAPFERIDEPEKPTSNASDKYSNETLLVQMKENVEYATYSSLYNKLSAHSTKCQINFENSSVNITPISSPTYGDDTIASPSPVRRSMNFHMGGEIDGRLTYPPIPYILHEIDLGRLDINKPLFIDKLKKTIQLDPRIFRTHVKKQLMTMCKPLAKTSNALVPLTTGNATNLSASFAQPTTTSMVSLYDPRNRTPAVMTDIATPPMAQQTALTPYNNINGVVAAAAAATTTPSSLSPFMHTDISNAVPLALQYHAAAQPILQPQQQQTPNMFLYGCLQRSPWYQSLMSTMKIQINQSISQLVRALNNFHRERLLNPEMLFDVFKIDCAGELLEIMRNLGIFVDANGIINEQRHVPSFGGRSCCNAMPVNATYSFIQQVLTPNTHCTSMTTASSTYNNAASGAAVGALNVNEPFVSCYIKAPEQPAQKHSHDCATTHEDNNSNCNRNFNNNNNCDNCSKNNNNNHSYNQNSNNNNRRYGGGNQFRKPYDNNYNNNGNNSYQQRSNQRSSSYSHNPRFSKPGLTSPSRTNFSPPNSPRGGFEGGSSGNSYGGGGFGRGGRFNNNRRFNNFKNKDNSFDNNGGSSWPSSSDTNDNRYNNKFQNNNSPTRNTSPNSSYQTGSPHAAAAKSSPPPANNSASSSKKNLNDEECWDSDN